jgi:2-aminoadipate transaminase
VVSPDNILIANGSGNALSLAFSTFVDIGDPIITEAPTFSGTLNTIRRHGAEIHGVPVDADGIDTGAVREVLEKLRSEGRRCKLIYTIVNFQNPSGPTMSLQRRKELVELAAEFETLILEDDAYGELRFEGHTIPSIYALDPNGRTIRAGTLSKILGAHLRDEPYAATGIRNRLQKLQSLDLCLGIRASVGICPLRVDRAIASFPHTDDVGAQPYPLRHHLHRVQGIYHNARQVIDKR